MLVDLLGRARAALGPALIVVAALVATTAPLSSAAAQMSTAPPTSGPPMNDPPTTTAPMNDPPMGRGPDMPPMGGDMPMGGMPMGGMPGTGGDMPGSGMPEGPGAGPADWMSNPMLMQRERERRSGDRMARLMPNTNAADAGEQYVPDEVVITVAPTLSGDDIKALLKRYNVYVIEQEDSELGGVSIIRARILDQRDPLKVAASMGGDGQVTLAEPNFVYRLQRAPEASDASPPLQYALANLRLTQAHGVARGDAVLVGMIDSAVDPNHPDLDGTIAAIFDATAGGPGAHPHGTAVASLIAGHGKLTGSAPRARLLVARAFDNRNAKGNSFTVLKSIDWLAGRGARIINMSFAGAADPTVRRLINAAYARGIVLIAAAGNAGPNSPPLYPAAEPKVIAVTATDASDRLYGSANRGGYIAVAAPGVDVFVAAPDGGYGIQSGTSFSAAEISGIAALMIQRHPKLTPDQLRAQLVASARAAGAGVKVADAYKAVTAGTTAAAAGKPKARR